MIIFEQLIEIRINSTSSNMDKGFRTLMNSGLSVICLEDEKYVVPESALEGLKKEGVLYELVRKECNAPTDKS